MLSNIASYFFGGESSTANNEESKVEVIYPHHSNSYPQTNVEEKEEILNEDSDDWVMVGGNSDRAPPLGSLNVMTPAPYTGSPDRSSAASNNEEAINDDASGSGSNSGNQGRLTRSGRRLAAAPFCQTVSLPQMKAMRSAQKTKEHKTSKKNAAKNLTRQNKAVKSNKGSKRASAAQNSISFTNREYYKRFQ